MVTIVVAVAVFVVFLLASRQWNALTSNDPGYMSPKWLAEYNAQHS